MIKRALDTMENKFKARTIVLLVVAVSSVLLIFLFNLSGLNSYRYQDDLIGTWYYLFDNDCETQDSKLYFIDNHNFDWHLRPFPEDKPVQIHGEYQVTGSRILLRMQMKEGQLVDSLVIDKDKTGIFLSYGDRRPGAGFWKSTPERCTE